MIKIKIEGIEELEKEYKEHEKEIDNRVTSMMDYARVNIQNKLFENIEKAYVRYSPKTYLRRDSSYGRVINNDPFSSEPYTTNESRGDGLLDFKDYLTNNNNPRGIDIEYEPKTFYYQRTSIYDLASPIRRYETGKTPDEMIKDIQSGELEWLPRRIVKRPFWNDTVDSVSGILRNAFNGVMHNRANAPRLTRTSNTNIRYDVVSTKEEFENGLNKFKI